jgi:hypothetical protein
MYMNNEVEDTGISYWTLSTAMVVLVGGLGMIGALTAPLLIGTPFAGICSLNHLWLLSALVTCCAVMYFVLMGIMPQRYTAKWPRAIHPRLFQIIIAMFLIANILVLAFGHRKYVLIIAVAQALLVCVWSHKRGGTFTTSLLGAVYSWTFTVGIMFTPLQNWLLSALPSTGIAAIVFAFALGLVLIDRLYEETSIADSKRQGFALQLLAGLSAAAFFAELSMRTDHILNDWIPYHRSYYVDPATLVRAGHWLLWDIPSQYGFLSELAIALMPAQNTWQALYWLMAIILTIEALMLFVIFRWERRGWINYVVALAVSAACLFSSEATRYPFGARLYPQQGMRFLWTMGVLFAAFGQYISRESVTAQRAWWCASVLWSFETFAWTSLVWFAFLVFHGCATMIEKSNKVKTLMMLLVKHLLPIGIIPAVLVLCVNAYYMAHLGHAPDWHSYVEFSSAYTGEDVAPAISNVWGGGLALLVLLSGSAVYAIAAARAHKWGALSIILTCFVTVWTAASYYVIEPFDQHVNMLFELIVLAFGILAVIEQKERLVNVSTLLARLSIVPVMVLVISTAFGEPARIAAIRAPFMPGYQIDPTQSFPELPAELLALMKQAGITYRDRVNLPNSAGWSKVSTGLILPFERDSAGVMQQIVSWLPMNPTGEANTFYTLPLDRRQVYTERFLALEPRAGWWIVHHEVADCGQISPRLHNKKVINSANYSAALCSLQSR